MEKRVANILMLCIIAGMIIIPTVSAAGYITSRWGSGWSWIDSFLGTQALTSFQQFLVYLAIFLIIFVASADIINTFGFFSNGATSWTIGLALALIVAASGGLASLALTLFGFVAAFGTIAIAAAIGSSFAVAAAVHLGLSGLGEWIQKRNLMMRAAKGEAEAVAGLKALESVGKQAAHG